jgi:hypothetical protein
MKAWLNARPTIVVTGSSQYNRENLAAALLKHTFRFELLNNPQPYGAYFGDAYTEALDMRGREGTAALHELAEFKVLALLEVQNLEDQDKRNLRALLWKRRHSQITIMTSGTPHLTKVFDEDVRQLISQDLRLIEL